ncbi:hypothetical protein LTS08_002751 [Lithohypha guttulata]|uniref:uncharacterized protein n=1 Tax=Lithohypha guttulata TaxID=1690604 RepID=UPI002DE100DD|nr:hypothetical protein LTR51_000592 [Lithohypha guttulata]KAK5103337.1 hypothetical protein LTS08_002751 [Lithohypha guttulata]
MSATRLIRKSIPLRASQLLPRAPSSHSYASQARPNQSEADKHLEDKRSVQAGNANNNATKIDRQSYEYSLTGTDDGVANDQQVSYEKGSDPARSRELAGENSSTNPLEVSPANPDASLAGTEYVATTEFRPTKAPTTIQSQGVSKTKTAQPADDRVNRTFAGGDKRKPGHPRDVAKDSRLVTPGTR